MQFVYQKIHSFSQAVHAHFTPVWEYIYHLKRFSMVFTNSAPTQASPNVPSGSIYIYQKSGHFLQMESSWENSKLPNLYYTWLEKNMFMKDSSPPRDIMEVIKKRRRRKYLNLWSFELYPIWSSNHFVDMGQPFPFHLLSKQSLFVAGLKCYLYWLLNPSMFLPLLTDVLLAFSVRL